MQNLKNNFQHFNSLTEQSINNQLIVLVYITYNKNVALCNKNVKL